VSLQSVAWTLFAGWGAIVIGVASGSLVLAAFGAVGLVDALGSIALAHHFRHGLRHARLADHLERLAQRIVIAGLLVVGAGALVAGSTRLAHDHRITSPAAGTCLAAASLVILTTLSVRKRRLARLVASSALRSDGHLSAVGAAQAAVTLAGVLTAMIGWRWADPAAAMAVGAVATMVGVHSWRRSSEGDLPAPAPEDHRPDSVAFAGDGMATGAHRASSSSRVGS
jgi:divalent metal cation (Fe/Co/Zn/Cd) transporter